MIIDEAFRSKLGNFIENAATRVYEQQKAHLPVWIHHRFEIKRWTKKGAQQIYDMTLAEIKKCEESYPLYRYVASEYNYNKKNGIDFILKFKLDVNKSDSKEGGSDAPAGD